MLSLHKVQSQPETARGRRWWLPGRGVWVKPLPAQVWPGIPCSPQKNHVQLLKPTHFQHVYLRSCRPDFKWLVIYFPLLSRSGGSWKELMLEIKSDLWWLLPCFCTARRASLLLAHCNNSVCHSAIWNNDFGKIMIYLFIYLFCYYYERLVFSLLMLRRLYHPYTSHQQHDVWSLMGALDLEKGSMHPVTCLFFLGRSVALIKDVSPPTNFKQLKTEQQSPLRAQLFCYSV